MDLKEIAIVIGIAISGMGLLASAVTMVLRMGRMLQKMDTTNDTLKTFKNENHGAHSAIDTKLDRHNDRLVRVETKVDTLCPKG